MTKGCGMSSTQMLHLDVIWNKMEELIKTTPLFSFPSDTIEDFYVPCR